MDTKQCIACKEDILVDALKCKHCYQIQSASANLKNKPWFNWFGVFVVSLLIIWLTTELILLTTGEVQKPTFDIQSPKLHVAQTKDGLNIRCIASVKNDYLEHWSDFSTQAKFKNSAGETIDVLHDKPKLSVYPKFDFDIMVSGIASAANHEYQSCELAILDAD